MERADFTSRIDSLGKLELFGFSDLTEAIDHLLKTRRLNYRRVCAATGIHPSYFSRVMQQKGTFSQVQVFNICRFIGLQTMETDFIFMLWNLGNAQTKDEKEFFASKIRNLQEEKLKVSKKIDVPVVMISAKQDQLERYYSEAVTACVHMFLTIADFRRNPKKILNFVNISETKLEKELDKLENLKLITRKGPQILKVQDSIHLDEESELSFQNHINWRLKTIQTLEKRESNPGDYHLSVIFSADEATKYKIKQVLREAVLSAQKLVGQNETPEGVYYLMMDLFS